MFDTALYEVYMLSVYSAAQFTSSFIGPQILNLREVSACHQAPKAVLYRLAKFLLEALSFTSPQKPIKK